MFRHYWHILHPTWVKLFKLKTHFRVQVFLLRPCLNWRRLLIEKIHNQLSHTVAAHFESCYIFLSIQIKYNLVNVIKVSWFQQSLGLKLFNHDHYHDYQSYPDIHIHICVCIVLSQLVSRQQPDSDTFVQQQLLSWFRPTPQRTLVWSDSKTAGAILPSCAILRTEMIWSFTCFRLSVSF